MHVLRKVLLTAAFLVGIGNWALADDRVTVMLRSGEKLSGRFDGVANGQFYLDISNTDERHIPLDQIALIDLVGGASGLPETELSQARGGSHVLLTKDGNMTKGQLVRIDGSRIDETKDQAFVVFRTESGEERRVAMRDVGRLYLGNYPGAAPSTPTTQPGTVTGTTPATGSERVLTLPANTQWLDTGITVRQGDRFGISATGEITLSGDPNDKAGPSGALSGRRPTASAPLPQTPAGALIGRIGNGRPFGIGAGPTTIAMPGTGRLYLGINDDQVADNAGQYEIHLRGESVSSSPVGGTRRRPSR